LIATIYLKIIYDYFFEIAKSTFPNRTKRCKFSLPEHALAIVRFPCSILMGNGESALGGESFGLERDKR